MFYTKLYNYKVGRNIWVNSGLNQSVKCKEKENPNKENPNSCKTWTPCVGGGGGLEIPELNPNYQQNAEA